MGLAAVGASVRGLGAWWAFGVYLYGRWMPLGGHFVDLGVGMGDIGLVHTGGLMGADEG